MVASSNYQNVMSITSKTLRYESFYSSSAEFLEYNEGNNEVYVEIYRECK